MSDIKWKKWPLMKPGDWNPSGGTRPKKSPAIKYEKGHYVTRPYFKYTTSKWDHGLIDVYELLLDPIKHNGDVVLLEFGVYYGESLQYYRDFFTDPAAKIIGFDHHHPDYYATNHHKQPGGVPWVDRPNVFLERGEQGCADTVKSLCDRYGPFDVVVDDGNHSYPQPTENTFRIAWPYVKEGGFYFIEDVPLECSKPLLDEIVLKNEGKGLGVCRSILGFGPQEGMGGRLLVLKKTKNRITGLDGELLGKK